VFPFLLFAPFLRARARVRAVTSFLAGEGCLDTAIPLTPPSAPDRVIALANSAAEFRAAVKTINEFVPPPKPKAHEIW
jgi:hypothetical protein